MVMQPPRKAVIGLVLFAGLVGIPMTIFYLTLGRESTSDLNIWLPMTLFFLFFAGVAFVMRFLAAREFAKHEQRSLAGADEFEQVEGKWRYVFTLSSQIAGGVLAAVFFGYGLAYLNGTAGSPDSVRALIALVVVTIAGSILVSIELWKNKWDGADPKSK